MRHFPLSLFFLIQFTYPFAQNSKDYKEEVAKYFNVSPFNKSPDSLVAGLLNDHDLVIDTIIYPTDTSLFYLRGNYKTFNPFSQKVKVVELILYQSFIKDKGQTVENRVLTYELLGIFGPSDSGNEQAVKEEKSIFLKIRYLFDKWRYTKSKRNDAFPTGIHSYQSGLAIPVYSGWGIWYKTKKDYSVFIKVNINSAQQRNTDF